VLTHVQILGAPPLKIWEGKKRSKIGAIYENFRVWAQISLEPIKITTISKGLDESDYLGVKEKFFCEILFTTNQVISANVDLP